MLCLRVVAKTTRWGDLDQPRDFRNRDKASRVNVWQLPVHLYDRALSDAVDTMNHHCPSGLSHPSDYRQKAGRIRRFNLGRMKLDAQRVRGQAEVKRRISEAMRKVLRSRPDVLVMEDLSRMRGRTPSRNLSRVVSRWMRSNPKERAEFLSQAGGSRLETVNPAYTQECPQCGYVHNDNRQGDRFHCRHCHFTAHADTVGAMNAEHRDTDPKLRERIQVFTPKEGVLKILRKIFERKTALFT